METVTVTHAVVIAVAGVWAGMVNVIVGSGTLVLSALHPDERQSHSVAAG